MDNKSGIEKRFIFLGNAVAFAAHIRRPKDFFIPAVASSCLPVTGGLAEAETRDGDFGEIVFKLASTRVHGDYADVKRAADFTHGNFEENTLSTNTFVESTLKGLKFEIPQGSEAGAAPVVRSFSVEELYLRLESVSDRRNPPSFRGLETVIGGVVVDGHRLKVVTAPHVFAQCDTHGKLFQTYEQDSDFRKQYSKLFYPTGNEKSGFSNILSKAEIPHNNGVVIGTVVTGLEWEDTEAPDTVITGNRLDIKGIGTFFFGEIMISASFRRVTLLRFQLGSPEGADGSACDGSGGWPPAA
jgi:hypothetical protein